MEDAHSPRGATGQFPVEIIEQILLYLTSIDVIRAKQVCQDWYSAVNGSPKLLRRIHKKPMLHGEDKDPHFKPATPAARTYPVPQLKHQGRPTLEVTREIDEKYLPLIHQSYQITAIQGIDIVNEYRLEYHELRAAFHGVRFPVGWPAEVKEIHCNTCDYFHRDFRVENLHPLLHFLGDFSLCFSGYSSLLFMKMQLFGPLVERMSEITETCWEHCCEDMLVLGKQLRRAYFAMKKAGIEGDYFTCPVTTKLVTDNDTTEHVVIEDGTGLQLGEALTWIITAFSVCIPTFGDQKPKGYYRLRVLISSVRVLHVIMADVPGWGDRFEDCMLFQGLV